MLQLVDKNQTANWQITADIKGEYATALNDMGDYQEGYQQASQSACLYYRHIFNQQDQALYELKLQRLFVLAECLANIGQLDDAILVQDEVICAFQVLYQTNAQQYLIEYANSLLVSSSYYQMQENFKQATDIALQAYLVVKEQPDGSESYVYMRHRIIKNLAACYEQEDQLIQALELLQDDLKIIQNLTNQSPTYY